MAPQQQERHEAFLVVDPAPSTVAEPARRRTPNKPSVCLWAGAALSAILLVGFAAAVAIAIYETAPPAAAPAKVAHADLLAADPDPADILLRQLRLVKAGDAAQKRTLHTSAGHIYRDQGRYADAAKHYKAAMDLSEGSYELIQAQHLLGLVEMHQGKLIDARHHLESAFILTDEGSDQLVSVVRTLADVRREMGNLDEALKLYDHAWNMALKRSDADGVAVTAAEISECHARRGEVEQALHWLKLANQQLDANRLDRGSRGDPAVAAKVDGYMAAVHHARGDINLAKDLYRKALRAQVAALRPSHPDLLATRMGMARAQRDSGDAHGALSAMDAVEKTLQSGPNEGPDLSRALILKADLLREAKRHKEAEKEINAALELQKRHYGTQDHPEVAVALSSYGSLLHDEGKLQEAHDRYKQALHINLKTVGKRHPETASTYNSLGTLYEDVGDDEEAQQHFTKCLEIQLHTVGEKSPDVANTYNNLATVLFRRGEREEAAELLRKALQVLDAAGVPKGNPDRSVYEENLAEVLNPTKSEADAEPAQASAEVPAHHAGEVYPLQVHAF